MFLQKQKLVQEIITIIINMKKIFFPLTIVVLFAMILALIGYDHTINVKNTKKYKISESKQETTVKNIKNKSNSQRIYCIGDSLTLGNEFASYPLSLEELSKSQVIKFGGNQDTTLDLSIRVGRTKIFTKNVTIPADKTPIDLPIYNEQGQEIDVLKNKGSNFDTVTINGIKGTLSYDCIRSVHIFTRNQSGKEIQIQQLSQIEGELPDFNENDIVIIFSGTYDKSNNLDIYRTVTYQRAIINQIKTQKYVVVSLTSRRQNSSVRDENNILKKEHGNKFLEFRSYLLSNGLQDANITPTEQDQQDLQNNFIPSSLLKDDKLNGNDAFNDLLAKQLYQKLQDLQYIKT